MWPFKKLGIKVTQSHIDKGKPKKSSSCPIALAIKEHFDSKLDVCVCHDRFYLNAPNSITPIIIKKGYLKRQQVGEPQYTELPWRAQKFIEKFDRGEAVKPFTF